MKMDNSKLAIIITITGILLLIFIATFNELRERELQKKYNYTVKQIETATINCVKDKKCKEGKITLKQLQKNKYIGKVKNPKTHKYFNNKSYMEYPDMAFYIVEK